MYDVRHVVSCNFWLVNCQFNLFTSSWFSPHHFSHCFETNFAACVIASQPGTRDSPRCVVVRQRKHVSPFQHPLHAFLVGFLGCTRPVCSAAQEKKSRARDMINGVRVIQATLLRQWASDHKARRNAEQCKAFCLPDEECTTSLGRHPGVLSP